MIELVEEKKKDQATVSIKVVGLGGAGGNTVNSIIESGCNDVEFIVANTDAQALKHSKAENKIQIGIKSTKGLGTGANPELGQRAAEEDLDKIMEHLGDADIVFLTAGMGGGTGSGALPVLAKALKDKGILSIVIVTKPFLFEGKKREKIANNVVEQLKQDVDTLLVIPNQKLLEISQDNVSMIDAFAMINDVLSQSVKGVSDIIAKPGHINVDFADVCTIMKDRGLAVMGTGKASGQDRASMAALEAISSPLLENMSIKGARGVLLNITGGRNLGLHELSEAASVIYEQADEDAHIILGSVVDESMTEEVVVTIIATGFDRPVVQDGFSLAGQREQEVKVQATVLDKSEPLHSEVPAMVESAQEEQAVDAAQDTAENQEHSAIEMKKEEPVQEAKVVDLDDLDVPAFLRKEAQKQKNENS